MFVHRICSRPTIFFSSLLLLFSFSAPYLFKLVHREERKKKSYLHTYSLSLLLQCPWLSSSCVVHKDRCLFKVNTSQECWGGQKAYAWRFFNKCVNASIDWNRLSSHQSLRTWLFAIRSTIRCLCLLMFDDIIVWINWNRTSHFSSMAQPWLQWSIKERVLRHERTVTRMYWRSSLRIYLLVFIKINTNNAFLGDLIEFSKQKIVCLLHENDQTLDRCDVISRNLSESSSSRGSCFISR